MLRNQLFQFLIGFFILQTPTGALAHPMDVGKLEISVVWTQVRVSLRLHTLAASHFLNESLPRELSSIAQPLFLNTLNQQTPLLNGGPCVWKSASLEYDSSDRDFLNLNVNADCEEVNNAAPSFHLPLPFLKSARPGFQLVTSLTWPGPPLTLVANSEKPQIEISADQAMSFSGFLHMGIAHIGALPQEWINRTGFRFPEGIDHILFVLVLILSAGISWELLKSVTGFTLGHSATLGLSTFQIIHFHSHWIEAFIALSIAAMAGLAFWRRNSKQKWIVAMVFGTVHGLGFASVMQEIKLDQDHLLPALFGFNLGVELGQLIIIGITLPLLWLANRISKKFYLKLHQSLCVGLFSLGSYWFVLRAIN